MATIPEAMAVAVQYHQTGQWQHAETIYKQILEADPNHASARHLLGVLTHQMGRSEEAVQLISQAIALRSDDPAFHCNLGTVLQESGHLVEAEACFVQALRLCPNYPEAHNNLGNTFNALGRVTEAFAHYHEAIRLRPTYVEAHRNLGGLYLDQGYVDEGKAEYQRAYQLSSDDRLRVLLATALPLVYESVEHMRRVRLQLHENIRQLQREGVKLDLTNHLALFLFYLAYQGMNDRDILRDLASLHAAPMSAPSPPNPLPPRERRVKKHHAPNRKIHVGFFSCYFYKQHTIGKLMQGLVANLSRDDFIVTALAGGGHKTALTDSIQSSADRFLYVPSQLPEARRLIAEQQLDVLLYIDIGLSAFTYTLAYSRLAPVQCVTWGHPSTTGLPTIDYYLSSELFESPEADEHYTEKLVRMKTIPAFCHRADLPQSRKNREHFGFEKGQHLYSCLQSVYKFHPEFDPILAGILRADPQGILVLSEGFLPHCTELLKRRFQSTLADVFDRVQFVAWQNYQDFLSLNAVCDVLLDPIHFGGGRTTYEGLGLGKPIVTLPSRLLRGRMCLGMYKKMRVFDCVASTPQEYIDIAVKLGTDADYRRIVSSKIATASDVLFEDMEAVRELERFFKEVCQRSSG